jgi:hypothetical protein
MKHLEDQRIGVDDPNRFPSEGNVVRLGTRNAELGTISGGGKRRLGRSLALPGERNRRRPIVTSSAFRVPSYLLHAGKQGLSGIGGSRAFGHGISLGMEACPAVEGFYRSAGRSSRDVAEKPQRRCLSASFARRPFRRRILLTRSKCLPKLKVTTP